MNGEIERGELGAPDGQDDRETPGEPPGESGGAVEPYVFDAELVDDDDPAAPRPPTTLARTRGRAVHLVTTLGASGPGAAGARFARRSARAGWTTGQGLMSWGRRAAMAATHGYLREQVRLTRIAGDRTALADAMDRLEAAKDARQARMRALPAQTLAVLRVVLIVVVGLFVLAVVGGIGAAVQPGGNTWSSWWDGVGGLLAWFGALLAWAWWLGWLVTLPGTAVLAWREGRRAAEPPFWLMTADEKVATESTIDERAISLALANLGISVLAKFAKGGGKLLYPVGARVDGNGTFAQVRLPLGVTVEDVNKRGKRLAANLQRAALEVWATTDEKYDDEGLLDLWIANKGALRVGAGEWPLLHEGVVDAFDGVPFGRSQRGAVVTAPLFENNYLIGGKPGQGKSAAMRTILLGVALDPTAEIMVYVMGESPDFKPFEPRLSRYAMGMDDAVAAEALQTLRDLLSEMERRGKVLSSLPGSPPKVSRKLAGRPGLGLHIIVCSIDECHELFMHPLHGGEAAALAVRLIKRGRKYGIVLILATQSPTADSIPRDVTRNVSCGVAFAVGDHVANDGLLGAGRYKAGVRATELRAGRDRGTAVTVGLTDNTFELVKGFYIPFEDGNDSVTPVIERAMADLAELRQTGRPSTGAIEAPVDHLADVWTALREEMRVRTTVLLGRLREVAPATYVPLSAQDFAKVLDGVGVPRGKSDGQSVVRREDVQRALSDRDEEDE